jgi:integrase
LADALLRAAKIDRDLYHGGDIGHVNPPTFHEIRSLAIRLYSDEYGAEFAQALVGHKSSVMTDLYRDNRGREWTEVKLKASSRSKTRL